MYMLWYGWWNFVVTSRIYKCPYILQTFSPQYIRKRNIRIWTEFCKNHLHRHADTHSYKHTCKHTNTLLHRCIWVHKIHYIIIKLFFCKIHSHVIRLTVMAGSQKSTAFTSTWAHCSRNILLYAIISIKIQTKVLKYQQHTRKHSFPGLHNLEL